MLASLRSQFDQLQDRRRRLLEQLSCRHAEQLRYAPGPESWSMLQVAEHLVLAEEGLIVILGVEHPTAERLRRTLKHRFAHLLVGLVFRLGLRARVPSRRVVPRSAPALPDIADRWEAIRTELATRLDRLTEETARSRFLTHPVLGPLDAPGALRFLVTHFDHHMRQIRRLTRSPRFPK